MVATLKKHETDEGKREYQGKRLSHLDSVSREDPSNEGDEVRFDREVKEVREKTFRWGGVENILGKGTASAKFYFRGSDWATFASGRD